MKFIRKMTSIIAAGAILSVSAAASAESPASGDAAGSGVWTDIAGETSTSYDNLFDVILDEKYSDIWYKYCAAVMGEDNAEAAAAFLKGSISSDIYGPTILRKPEPQRSTAGISMTQLSSHSTAT